MLADRSKGKMENKKKRKKEKGNIE